MPIYSKYTGVGGGTTYTFVGVAPITVTDVLGTVTTSMTQADSTTDGWLSFTDWNTFNSKQNALTIGDLTSSDITVTGGTGAVIGSGVTLALTKGNLTGDTNAQISITGGTNAVLGGGASISQAAASALSNGYLTSSDWSTFNSKQNALTFGNLTEATSSVLTISGGTGAVIGSGTSIQVSQAGVASSGYLSQTDWNTFNNKVTSVGATAPVASSGGTTPTISMTQSGVATDGWLSSTDWNTFNNKQPAGNYITALTGEVTATGPGSVTATIAGQTGNNDKVLATNGTAVTWQYAGLGAGALGTNNVILGRGKPASLSGTVNTLINNAGTALTTASNTVLIGSGAGAALTTQSNQIAIGTNALQSMANTTFVGNAIAIGFEAAKAATTVFQDNGAPNIRGAITIGYQAGYQSTNLQGVLYIGYQAGRGTGTHALNTYIGSEAGNAGSGNTAIGVQALQSQTSTLSVAVGNRALASCNASNNCATGYDAASVITSGAGNSAFGASSGATVTTGADNTMLGFSSGTLATNTQGSIALGRSARAGSNEFAVGSSNQNITTMLLGRGGASQTVANAVTLMTMRASGTTDTSMTLGTLTLAGSQGTGTGAGGDVIIATAPAAGVSGSTTNAHVERMRITATGNTQLQGNLLFSPDATYNIGALNATRPNNVFVANKIQIGGALDAIPSNPGSMAFVSSDAANNNTFRGVYYANVTDSCTMDLRKSRGTESVPVVVAANDRLGRVSFRGNESTAAGGVFNNSSYLQAVAEETFSATARGSRLEFYTTTSGTTTIAERLRLQTGSFVINEPGNDYDTRIEGDTDTNLVFVDASTDSVGVGTNVPQVKFHALQESAATNTVTNVLRVDSQSSGTPATGIGVGIEMAAETAAGNTEVGVVLEAVTTDVTSTSEDFDLVVKNMTAGAAATEKLRVGADGGVTVKNGNLNLATAGNGIQIKTGTNATAGLVTGLSGVSSTTVNTTQALTDSLIFVQPINTADKHGFSVSTIVNGTSFTVDFSGNYTGDLAWFIINQYPF